MPNLLLRGLHPSGPVPPEGNASLLLLQFGKTSKPSLTSPASPRPAPRPEHQERVSRNPLSPWSKVESGKPRQGCEPFTLPPAPSLAPSPEQECAALGSRCGWYLTPSHPHLTTSYVLCMQGPPHPSLSIPVCSSEPPLIRLSHRPKVTRDTCHTQHLGPEGHDLTLPHLTFNTGIPASLFPPPPAWDPAA